MNKDVIYIEPEDDITDIISKLENSKEKIVALVPPKKAGVLRSIVNIKLIAKAATSKSKTAVLVTTDPSIIKLAAATRVPVTKDLQSAPAVPAAETVTDAENLSVSVEAHDTVETEAETSADVNAPAKDGLDTHTKKSINKPNKASSKSSQKWLEWFKEHKKLSIGCGCGLVVFILVLVWAFVIAPAVDIEITIRTTSNNFSENVTFTSKLEEEDASIGKFYFEEKKKESKQEVSFTATGTKNVGEKASGKITLYAYFPIVAGKGNTSVSTSTAFSYNGLKYYPAADVSITWDGTLKDCDNADSIENVVTDSCLIYSDPVEFVAEEAGEKYNITASTSGWTSNASSVSGYASSDFTGGTDKTITIVTQADIDKAQESLTASTDTATSTSTTNTKKTASTSSLKEDFLAELAEQEDLFVITSSFKQTAANVVSTPAVGEEVKDGVTPKLSVTTTATVYTIDKTKVEEFISKKAKLGDDQKIYSINNPFIESFSEKESGYTGKLKTAYTSGPKVTEEDILEKVKGKKVGEVKAILSSISGVVKDSTTINTSFFWVNSVPNDPNKITINLNVEE